MQQVLLAPQSNVGVWSVLPGQESPSKTHTPPLLSQADNPASKLPVFSLKIDNNTSITIRAMTAPMIIHHMLALALPILHLEVNTGFVPIRLTPHAAAVVFTGSLVAAEFLASVYFVSKCRFSPIPIFP